MDNLTSTLYESFVGASREWLDICWTWLASIEYDNQLVISLIVLLVSLVVLLLARYQRRQLPFNSAAKTYRQLIDAISELRALIGITTSLDKDSAAQIQQSLERVATLAHAVKRPNRKWSKNKIARDPTDTTDSAEPDMPFELGSTTGKDAGAQLESEPPVGGEERLAAGLQKARSGLFGRMQDLLSGRNSIDAELKSGIEELLISCDFGVALTQQILQALDGFAIEGNQIGQDEIVSLVSKMVLQELETELPAEVVAEKVAGCPKVVLVVGVNGVGKTTTIGKLGYKFSRSGAKVMFGACDTFRAAADEQLELWADRANAVIVRGEANAKPTTVAYEAVHRANREDADILLIDTAGRLHNKVNLMNELEAVLRIIQREQPGAPHEVLLVIDGSTGQNAINQAREFNGRTKLSGLVLTKLDGTAKGGIVVAIKKELGVPIRYIGVGEGIEDLREFSPESFCNALFAKPENCEALAQSSKVGERRARRSRKRD